MTVCKSAVSCADFATCWDVDTSAVYRSLGSDVVRTASILWHPKNLLGTFCRGPRVKVVFTRKLSADVIGCSE